MSDVGESFVGQVARDLAKGCLQDRLNQAPMPFFGLKT
jgi:hypothetical protein